MTERVEGPVGPHTTVDVPLDEHEPVTRGAKKVVAARLTYYETFHPELEKRILEVETQDGNLYRFQRFSEDESWTFYNRERHGERPFIRKARLPESVRAVRDAVRVGDLGPAPEAREHAEQREHRAVSVAREALADGGIEEGDHE